MDKFFAVVGAVGVILLLFAVGAGVLALLCEVAGKAYDKFRFDIIYRRDAELGEILKSGSHWLSEYPEQAALLRFLGEHLQGGYSLYAGHWRESWERLRDMEKLRAESKGKP